MMAKPIRALESDYPMIQVLLKEVKQWLIKAVWFTDSPSLIGSHPLHNTLVEGENLTLQCTVTASNPEPNITWYRAAANDTPLSYGVNLTFINISRSHMGKYYCVVSNGVGNRAISRTATVNVLRKFWIHGKSVFVNISWTILYPHRFDVALLQSDLYSIEGYIQYIN